MSKIFAGIDPGFTGGVSFIEVDENDNTVAIDINPMPVIKTIECGETRTRLDDYALDEMIKWFKERIVMLTIEKQQAMRTQIFGKDQYGKSVLIEERTQGTSSSFKLGDQFGAIRMCAVSNKVPFQLVGAKKWQNHIFPACRKYGTKKTSIERAKELYPTANLIPNRARTEKHGLSDSLLIAHYGMALHKVDGGSILYAR